MGYRYQDISDANCGVNSTSTVYVQTELQNDPRKIHDYTTPSCVRTLVNDTSRIRKTETVVTTEREIGKKLGKLSLYVFF